MTHALFRKLVHWFGALIGIHVAARMVFAFFISRELLIAFEEEEFALADKILFYYCIAAVILVCFFYALVFAAISDNRRDIYKCKKDGNFTVLGYFKENYLKDDLIKIGMYIVFQLPLTVFTAIFGVNLTRSTKFEAFYILELGYYAFTGSPSLGLLLNVSLFAIAFLGFHLLFVFINSRYVDEIKI